MKILTQTNNNLHSISILLLRLTIGIILFVAGAGKVLGWFGGMGLETTIGIFTSKMHIPAFLAYLSCFTEFIGGFLLITGLLTRPAAVAVFINMLVATIIVAPNGFLKGGAAYPLTLTIISLVILLSGPMVYSLDAWIFRVKK
jgi:putative oxidoreductase